MPYTATDWKSLRHNAKGFVQSTHKKRRGYSLRGHVASKPVRLTPEQIADSKY